MPAAKRQAAGAPHALCKVLCTSAKLALGLLLAGGLSLSVIACASEIVSYAIVQGDGSLRVQGKTIRLFGI